MSSGKVKKVGLARQIELIEIYTDVMAMENRVMATASIPELLGYNESPNYLDFKSGNCDALTEHTHIFRKAVDKCGLQGVYVLRDDSNSDKRSVVPVVYICKADSDKAASKIHQIVWNQNIVPFLVIQTNQRIKLYSGFRYDHNDPQAGILEAAIEYNKVTQCLSTLTAESIDSGLVWKQWGDKVTPEKRVDWSLLSNLQKLAECLRKDGVDKDTSHALIGKYVYLHYLKDRDILSSRKLKKWGIRPESVFSRTATLKSFWDLLNYLQGWLNGKVFPLGKINAKNLKLVAGTFAGDSPNGQLHLDFEAYDFSYIPIETLSVVYEQFLHISETDGEITRGKQAGAYYTPIPLVNFILAELHERLPLQEGMKVLDPSCGSGAFLVQCYRHLIESYLAKHNTSNVPPVILRELLEKHVFGIDRDPDACHVAELSLILTLLDYVNPPDLERHPNFKLPNLQNHNIFQADFFEAKSSWTSFINGTKFDWIVGNPPWIALSSNNIAEEDQPIWNWMQANSKQFPIGGNQTAEAFAWKVTEYISKRGVVGLLLPAMTLFKNESSNFRKALFQQMHCWCVANFANMAYVLFAGRAELPAAAFFYSHRKMTVNNKNVIDMENEKIATYSPFVVNQIANKPSKSKKRQETWNIVINADEIRCIPLYEVITGDMLPWKLALWGSRFDWKLIRKMQHKYPSFEQYEKEKGLLVAEGLKKRDYPVDFNNEHTIDFKTLRNCGRIFVFPNKSFVKLPTRSKSKAPATRAGLQVSYPPHIFVDASRRFSVYSDQFIAIPSRHIGIVGSDEQSELLKTISLYLSSSFVTYHQFLSSPESGIHSTRSTLGALRKLPMPFSKMKDAEYAEWSKLHSEIIRVSEEFNSSNDTFRLSNNFENKELLALIKILNDKVYRVLDLNKTERSLVEDFVKIRMKLAKGKVSSEASLLPTKKECKSYLKVLKSRLDSFINDTTHCKHNIVSVYDNNSAMISIVLRKQVEESSPAIIKADSREALEFTNIRKNLLTKHSQWVYFNRDLRIYNDNTTYLFKPMQKLFWTETRALLDAGEIIAETLSGGE